MRTIDSLPSALKALFVKDPKDIMSSSLTISPASLRTWASSVLVAVGLSPGDADACAEMLVQTSLWGIDSHGIARLPHYLDRLTRGSIVARPTLSFEETGAATGNVDGGDGLGFLVCRFAMEKAIALARSAGAGIVGVRNSSHCGAVGLYTRQATRQGMIGVGFTHSDSFVAPHGGNRAFFGTNPISIALPAPNSERPLVVDMATSALTWNRIANARLENRPVEPGCAIDDAGSDTTDPHAVAALKPMALHKGYAMAFLIDMLCGPLNGMAFGPHVAKMYDDLDAPRHLGSLFIAFDPGRFFGGAGLAPAVTAAISEVKKQGDAVLHPGEPEYISEDARLKTGIPIEPGLQGELARWAKELHLPLPLA
ncbi:MAG: Ldh family oxidoreductase [Spirochaetia bacterium]